jgi:hypothetical protein
VIKQVVEVMEDACQVLSLCYGRLSEDDPLRSRVRITIIDIHQCMLDMPQEEPAESEPPYPDR